VSTKLVRTCGTEAPSHHPRRVRVFKKGTPKEYWNEQCRGSLRIGPLPLGLGKPRHVVDTRRHGIGWPRTLTRRDVVVLPGMP